MINLFGKDYLKRDLLEKIGDVSQLCGVCGSVLNDGAGKGVRIARFWNGSGLEFEVVLDRGMGIGAFRYNGIPFAWMSPTGVVAPEYYDSIGDNSSRGYFGGLMHMAGFRQVGMPCEDGGEQLGLHGRAANLPAFNVSYGGKWRNEDDYIAFVNGRLHEVTALGENIVFDRRVYTKLGENTVYINDTVENAGFRPTEFMVLYHTNFGFPLFDKNTKLVLPSKSCVDWQTKEAVGEKTFSAFDIGEKEEIYLHKAKAKDDNTSAYMIYNETLGENGLGLVVRYDSTFLPDIVQWFNTNKGANVLEIGPSNCTCHGRKAVRESGGLQYLEPGEKREISMALTVLDGMESIEKLTEEIEGI